MVNKKMYRRTSAAKSKQKQKQTVSGVGSAALSINSSGADSGRLSTEQRILDAARKEFIQTGLKGARMQSIADSAGVNKALLHYYFRSKEKLYHSALREVAETFWGALDSQGALTATARNPREFIQSVVGIYIHTMAAHPDFARMIIRELADGGVNFATIIESISEKIGQAPRRFIALMAESGHSAKIAPVHVFMNILGMCAITFLLQPAAGALHEKLGLNAAYDLSFFEERIRSIVTMACDGLLPRAMPGT